MALYDALNNPVNSIVCSLALSLSIFAGEDWEEEKGIVQLEQLAEQLACDSTSAFGC